MTFETWWNNEGRYLKSRYNKGCAKDGWDAALKNIAVAAPLSGVGPNGPSLTPTASAPRDAITPKPGCAINGRGCVQEVCNDDCSFYTQAA
jgi:hypothetical protein